MSAEQAAEQIERSIGHLKRGALRMFGDWFGRPFDNCHVAVTATAVDDVLTVVFNEGEHLVVSSPTGFAFDEHLFRIDQATRVVWTWHSYGKPKTDANLYTIEHWLDGSEVHARSDVDWYEPLFAPTPNAPAAELL